MNPYKRQAILNKTGVDPEVIITRKPVKWKLMEGKTQACEGPYDHCMAEKKRRVANGVKAANLKIVPWINKVK